MDADSDADAAVLELARELRHEARRSNERRLLVLAGDRDRGYDALEAVLDGLSVPITRTTLVGPDDRLRCEQVPQSHAGDLLGTTRDVVAIDTHAELRPNALGKLVGTVDGGGLLVLLTPPLDAWPDRRDGFDESLAVPPFSLSDVTGRFRRRLVETLCAHRGIAIVDCDAGAIEDDGLTRPAPRLAAESTSIAAPDDHRFPAAAYEACLTADQAEAVAAFESLAVDEDGIGTTDRQSGDPQAVVLEADRGRGKSSAAGLAAGAFAADGRDVLVTAPQFRNAREVLDRAGELCETLDVATTTEPKSIETSTGGRVRFRDPDEAVDRLERADVVVVDEAAALPVATLGSLLDADCIAFATTIHGYEGAGRGFSVRFRDRLAASDHAVTDCTMSVPIRYAAGDPIEVWAFRALLLDARPPVEPLVADAKPDSDAIEYRRIDPDALLADETLLREAFGLLVLAHYRTEPNDLARLLDAPNLEARALVHDDHVVSVALLAREGNLASETRSAMYEGGRVRGNMLPDVLTSQLRDEAAGDPAGLRIVRIATHHVARSRGLGSRLLAEIRTEFADDVDWLGTGFGATPGLLRFWNENGYGTIHVSTTRNDASGEYSALMLAPTSDDGRALHDRHADRFARRFAAVCSDSLADLDPDVARAVLRSVDATPPLDLSDHEWRVVAGAAYGPGLFDVNPGPFRSLVVRYLTEDPDSIDLTAREERLLVLRALQGREWPTVADRLDYPSSGQCMRALGEACCPLVDRYGTDAALAVRDRFAGE
ncbi:tRNA(Met) cytidine acetyltransferase TmcA [Halosolutus halophilus]|uniref:tRNA(Met) cytidine acetyltransferase TmcA n=1 Tax=Halosolutus halophilus TaxID=1552990 RepID=UPI002235172A|nr:tRNA(Met) cytidine acetyltransferase TmcA [Halosolutus halophilus]